MTAVSALPAPQAAPHSVEAEQALIGAVFVNNDAYAAVAPALKSDHFFDPVHRLIFTVCGDLIANGQRATPLTVRPHLADDIRLGSLTINQYLARLTAEATTIINAADFGQTIFELAMRRQLADFGETLAEAARSPDSINPPKLLVSNAISELANVPADLGPSDDGLARNRATTIKQAGAGLFDRLLLPASDETITTGLHDLDDLLGGYYRGDLVIVAARPSMGKTSFLTSTMMRCAKSADVALFSLEMDADRIAARCVSDLIYDRSEPVAYVRMMPGKRAGLSERELGRIKDGVDLMASLPIHIDDRAGLTIAEIAARAKRIAQRAKAAGRRLGVVFVDYLGLIKASDRYAGNKVQETGEISNALKQLAKNLDVAVVALSQLSRSVESRDDKRPMLADLRNSGDIEQDADAVLFLYRESYYLERQKSGEADKELDRRRQLDAVRHVLEINVAKNRNGATRTIHAFCDMGSSVIRDAADSAGPE